MASNLFRKFLYTALPKPAVRKRNDVRGAAVLRVLVIRNGPNPTFSYYLDERLRRSQLPVDIRNVGQSLHDVDPSGLFVIVCRYVSPSQLLWLFRNRAHLAGVSLFIDDDIAATVADNGGSLSYKAFLIALGIAPIPALNRLLTEIWVSTPYLAERLARNGLPPPIVLPPYPSPESYTHMAPRKIEDRVRLAFHATGNHDAEHEFLVPIVRDVLKLTSRVDFEVTPTSRRLARLWTDACLPPERVTLRPKRKWEQYLFETRRQPVDILLVPLLQSRVNDARSDTKRFDCARMGAAAIFSRGHVYGTETNAEILIDNDPKAWVKAILELTASPELRCQTKNATETAIKDCLARNSAMLPFVESLVGR